MRNRPKAILLAVSLASAAVLVPAQAASAHTSCSVGGSKTSTSTTAYANDCTLAQARIDRYIASYPTSYYGYWDSYKSFVSNSNGTNSGNYVRGNLHGEPGLWNRL